jgi:hypothetical protein
MWSHLAYPQTNLREALTALINNPITASQTIKHIEKTTTADEFNTDILQLYNQGDTKAAPAL